MGWRDCYSELKAIIESEKFKATNRERNPNDPHSALVEAIRHLYNEYNKYGHKI